MDPKEIKNKFKAKCDHLRTWVNRFSNAQNIAPLVQRELEKAEWEFNAVNDCPDEAEESLACSSIGNAIDREIRLVRDVLPIMPDYDKERFPGLSGVTSSGTMVISNFIYKTYSRATPEAIEYSTKYIDQYHAIQQANNLSSEARNMIEKLKNSETLQRFDRAEKAYWLLKTGTGERSEVALELRNLLDGIKGNLFNLARIAPRENMTWQIMADRLTKGGLGSDEHSVIIEQESIRSALYENLSKIAKGYEGGTPMDIEKVWSNVLDHIYTVFRLVKI